MTLDEFKKTIKKVSSKREHKIKNSLGVYDAYKYYRTLADYDKTITSVQYSSIIRKVNTIIGNLLASGQEIPLPARMGKLEIRKKTSIVKLKDNKVVNNFPIDWDATLKLWYSDEEAYNKKILIKQESREVYRVYYNRHNSNYKNKSYYQFKPNREIKLNLKKQVKDNNIEAHLLY